MEAQHYISVVKCFVIDQQLTYEKKNTYLLDGNIFAAFLNQNLTAFVDLVYMCGLEKRTMHFDFFQCRVPTFKCQKVVKHGGHRGISFLFFD